MKFLNFTPELYNYIVTNSVHEDPILKQLRLETQKLPVARMQISPDQAQFMQLLLRLIGARKVLEIGTFTGYSALAMAFAIPEDGQIISCDVNEEWTKIAVKFWQLARQDHKIKLRISPALDYLNLMLQNDAGNSFDFIFIDADKSNYLNYYELALKLITPNGLIVIDNVLWDGKVIDQQDNSRQTISIRNLNQYISQDQRVFCSLLPVADGLFLIKLKS